MANLLIVDDELSMRQFLTHLFQRDGHAIRVAENGRQAMTLLREQPADVIISDVKMPDMGGIEAVREICKTDPDAKILMCSAMGQQALVVEAIQAGAKDFVVKPFQPSRVLEAVQRVLG